MGLVTPHSSGGTYLAWCTSQASLRFLLIGEGVAIPLAQPHARVTSTFTGSDRIWKQNRLLQLGGLALRGSAEYPGYHRDDWEAASVRVDGTGDVRARVTSHGHWQWCKWAACKGRWGPFAGWTRVSRGSHSGHLPARARRPWGWPLRRPTEFELQRPGTDLHERTTTPDGIRLVPLETIDRRSYRPQDLKREASGYL
jgi:hypothetical protein